MVDHVLWEGPKLPNGYPIIDSKKPNERKSARVQAYIQQHGPIPDGYRVIPSCGIQDCMSHLILASLSDIAANSRAAITRTRSGRAPLTIMDAVKFSVMYHTLGYTCNQIAKEFGVKRDTVMRLRRSFENGK